MKFYKQQISVKLKREGKIKLKGEKRTRKEQEWTSEDEAVLLFDKIASTDDLVSWPESELVLLLLDEWPAPFDLCASAACSHICNK